MNSNQSYEDLKLKVVLMPEGERWGAQPRVHHWLKLEECRSEAFDRVSRAYKALDEINADVNLSPAGKADKCRKVAEKAIAGFRESPALERARTSVASQQAKWAEKVNEAIVAPADPGQAMVYGQIRSHIAGLDENARLSFIDKHFDDRAVVSAVLTGPEFLSGLTPVEIGVIRQKLAKRVLAPEVAEQRDLVEKALAVAERGWLRATSLIEERAGLRPVKVRAA